MNLEDLKTMTADELKNIISLAQEILNDKKEAVIFEISGKALKAASYPQIQLFERIDGR